MLSLFSLQTFQKNILERIIYEGGGVGNLGISPLRFRGIPLSGEIKQSNYAASGGNSVRRVKVWFNLKRELGGGGGAGTENTRPSAMHSHFRTAWWRNILDSKFR